MFRILSQRRCGEATLFLRECRQRNKRKGCHALKDVPETKLNPWRGAYAGHPGFAAGSRPSSALTAAKPGLPAAAASTGRGAQGREVIRNRRAGQSDARARRARMAGAPWGLSGCNATNVDDRAPKRSAEGDRAGGIAVQVRTTTTSHYILRATLGRIISMSVVKGARREIHRCQRAR
jgi:hypothetical protein